VCPAAPLVAASAAGEGGITRFGPVTASPEGDAVLFVTSYVGSDGVAVGLGAAARCDDAAGVATAGLAVATWSAALRTRRVLRPSGEPPGPGAGCAACLAGDAAATCPAAGAARAAVRAFVADGDTVLVLGRRGDAAVESLSGEAPGHVIVVENASDLPPAGSLDRVSFVLAPGVPVQELVPLAALARERFAARGPHPGQWCYTASDRADALRLVAAASDALLVLAVPGCADAAALARLVPGTRPRVIDDVALIRPEWVAGAATVGLAEAASAPAGMAATVIAALSGLGPLSVVHRAVATTLETVTPARAEPGGQRLHVPARGRSPREAGRPGDARRQGALVPSHAARSLYSPICSAAAFFISWMLSRRRTGSGRSAPAASSARSRNIGSPTASRRCSRK
jgi:4-hydroxy-3-methylbut-2-enyl diphosphate reductase